MMSACTMMKCLLSRCGLQSILGLVALSALIFAFTAEYGFGLVPCSFCVYERWVFAAILAVAIADLTVLKTSSGRLAGFLQLLILLVGCGLTLFHVGMEMHWWKGPASCSGPLSLADGPLTVEQVRAKLNAQPVVRCDQVNWAIFGVSATIWNLLLQMALAVYASVSLFFNSLCKAK